MFTQYDHGNKLQAVYSKMFAVKSYLQKKKISAEGSKLAKEFGIDRRKKKR